MNYDSETDRRPAELKRAAIDQSAGNELKDPPGRDSAERIENNIFSDINDPATNPIHKIRDLVTLVMSKSAATADMSFFLMT